MRVLVVASGAITGDDLRSALADEQTLEAEVMIISPQHPAAIRFLMSDADEALANASASQPGLGDLDHGELSHAQDPTQRPSDSGERDIVMAISDALVDFRADRILLFVGSTRDGQRERVDQDALEFELGIPVERVGPTLRAGDPHLNGRRSHASA